MMNELCPICGEELEEFDIETDDFDGELYVQRWIVHCPFCNKDFVQLREFKPIHCYVVSEAE